ncbi:MAG: hypothetical protein ACRDY6_19705, partial [Acidimicrobiia bacterium]
GAARVLAGAAAEAGAGPFELTNRANVQLRGLPDGAVPVVRDALVTAGIVPPDAGADERRNVLASPTAGVDTDELVDTRPLVTAVADRLASARCTGLSPKFGVLVDGGGAVHVRGRKHDVAFGALRADGAVRYEVRFAEPLPLAHRPDEMVSIAEPERVLEVIDSAIAGEHVSSALEHLAGNDLALPIRVASVPAVGVQPQKQPERVWVGAVPLLGRLDAEMLAGLADLATRAGDGDLRITPWRGVVLTGITDVDAARVVGACERLGFVCDADHPANVVVACAGARGCAAGFVDTQADARSIIDRLAAVPVSRRPGSIHVSGCDKGCARPQPAEVSLVGGPVDGTYDVYVERPESDGRFGARVETRLDPQRAIDVAAGDPSP